MSPTPSRTFVMSYIRLFCTCSVSAASFRSRTPSGDAWSRSQNFFVSVPSDVSVRRSAVGSGEPVVVAGRGQTQRSAGARG